MKCFDTYLDHEITTNGNLQYIFESVTHVVSIQHHLVDIHVMFLNEWKNRSYIFAAHGLLCASQRMTLKCNETQTKGTFILYHLFVFDFSALVSHCLIN